VNYQLKQLEIKGSTLSGNSGDTNRQFTLEKDSISENLQIIKDENILQKNINYTIDSNNTITFLNLIYDNEIITIDYMKIL
jgi:predicted transcriptional regulator